MLSLKENVSKSKNLKKADAARLAVTSTINIYKAVGHIHKEANRKKH